MGSAKNVAVLSFVYDNAAIPSGTDLRRCAGFTVHNYIFLCIINDLQRGTHIGKQNSTCDQSRFQAALLSKQRLGRRGVVQTWKQSKKRCYMLEPWTAEQAISTHTEQAGNLLRLRASSPQLREDANQAVSKAHSTRLHADTVVNDSQLVYADKYLACRYELQDT